nr:uncharacterized protein LOC129382513 isoform X1 [Dermacentor andersoni]XP_054922571.1 uncharacterized protein LOC129382513 isoform X1 [Dermacentor andersoni]
MRTAALVLVLVSAVGRSLGQNVDIPFESRIMDSLEGYSQLVKYQDAALCFPLNQTWFLLYRTNQYNEMFGGNNTCVRMGPRARSPMRNLGIDVKLAYSKDKRADIHIRFQRSHSAMSDRANGMEVTYADDDNRVSQSISVIYSNCDECMVLKHVDSGDSHSCSLFAPASVVTPNYRPPPPQCEFIYLLLCGNTQYRIFGDCCKDDDEPPPYTDSPQLPGSL